MNGPWSRLRGSGRPNCNAGSRGNDADIARPSAREIEEEDVGISANSTVTMAVGSENFVSVDLPVIPGLSGHRYD